MRDISLRTATHREVDFLYALHRATLQTYVVQTWGQWDDAWQAQRFQAHLSLMIGD